jgi:LmbE family N-acetylglucosaminyl deacetylase
VNLLFAPHSDDESLFAAFTVLRFCPRVIICFPSTRDYGATDTRLHETQRAMDYLGGAGVEQWDGYDLVGKMRSLLPDFAIGDRVFAPSPDTTHPDHRCVSRSAVEAFGADRVTLYHTYKDGLKVRSDKQVSFEPAWVQRKLLALAQYTSQLEHPRANQFFTHDLLEYYA